VLLEVGIGIRRSHGIAAQAARIEDLGFDSVHIGEHVFFHGPTPHALIGLAVAAGATTKLKLLSAVALLPLYPAAQLAKMASVLDIACDGRLRLGVGVGGEYPPEYLATGVPHAERGRRANEALEIITRLFTGEPVTFAGRWAQLDGLRLDPAPTSPAGPPIWVAGRGEPAQRRAGRYGSVWMPYMCTPEQLHEGLKKARGHAVEGGRQAATIGAAAYLFIAVDNDGQRARRLATETVGSIYRQDFSRLGRYLVAGTPAECVTRLLEYRDAGASALQLNPACPEDMEPEMVELIAAAVLPQLHR
jgi:alkanesulfonate monooxygenase SsuD/methylene tetrahydromethanopterin reductase-like flavin-dependent oxidoreductase (luciferase family)